MREFYLGIDNGVSGSIAVLIPKTGEYFFSCTPHKVEQDYTKKRKNIGRLDGVSFSSLIVDFLAERGLSPWQGVALLERPMVNPQRFQATATALRCHEATLVILETLKMPLMYVDSKQWQKELLPPCLGSTLLKRASLDIGCRLFPRTVDSRHPDRDAILIAEFGRRKDL
jgi:hypothetical protein